MEFSAFNRPTKFPFSWLTLFERIQAGCESLATDKNNLAFANWATSKALNKRD